MMSTKGIIGEAIMEASVICLITAAGGSFGNVLKESQIGEFIGDSLQKANLGIWIPVVIAISIKAAQGSTTVAILTAASVMKDLMDPLGFTSQFEKALVVTAIGAGAMGFAHVNNSFFW
eukprot:CAMPEP_0168511400 /NCGR_PEP_ID=MMETSP0405-20121227/2107_1 /TAXON_ID=498012 /ORGANISM="Trichosphaerium sp, Strain Am-I-7 wt" /LENGTH=118 /DNA_ID=CAMNT_0008529559 /DNA_START=1 /DNA_END=354 /DNA_ORIENTATION=+